MRGEERVRPHLDRVNIPEVSCGHERSVAPDCGELQLGPGQDQHLHHLSPAPGGGAVQRAHSQSVLGGDIVRLCSHWSSSYITALSLVESFIVLLRQHSYVIKNQLKAAN